MCINARNGKLDMFHDTPTEAPGRSICELSGGINVFSGEDVDFGDLS